MIFFVRLFPLKDDGYSVWARMEFAMFSMRKVVSWKAFYRWLIERYVRFRSILFFSNWCWLLSQQEIDQSSFLLALICVFSTATFSSRFYGIIQLSIIMKGYWHRTSSPTESSRHNYGWRAIEIMEVVVSVWNHVWLLLNQSLISFISPWCFLSSTSNRSISSVT